MSTPMGPGLLMSRREIEIDVWTSIGSIIMGLGVVCEVLLGTINMHIAWRSKI